MAPGAALREALSAAVAGCGCECVALSGGLDSSIVAALAAPRRPAARAVIADGLEASDLAYCQIAARHCGLRLEMDRPGPAELLGAAGRAVRMLRSFNDAEVRNGAVVCAALEGARRAGHRSVMTGDGADELFCGYGFMLRLPPGRLESEARRIRASMRFSSHAVGRALGVRVESPFLDPAVAGLAASYPAALNVGERGGRRYGKMPLREEFARDLPPSVAWRPKAAMQDGAGSAGLPGAIDAAMPDGEFRERAAAAERADGVVLRTKESLHYYEEYRRHFGPPERREGGCRYCGHELTPESGYCRGCGATSTCAASSRISAGTRCSRSGT